MSQTDGSSRGTKPAHLYPDPDCAQEPDFYLRLNTKGPEERTFPQNIFIKVTARIKRRKFVTAR